MRLLWITSLFPPSMGGVQRYVYQYSINMDHGINIVLCNTSDDISYIDVDNCMSSRGQRVFRAPIFPTDMGVYSIVKTPFILYRFCLIVYRIIKREQVTAVIFGHSSFYYLYALWFLKLFLDIPFILTFHGEDIPIIKIKSNNLFRYLILHADKYLCNSAFTRERLMHFLDQKLPCTIAYPGVEDRFFKELKNQNNENKYSIKGKKILYTVGRLDQRKGHDLVISALPEIVRKYPDVIYIIAGTGSYMEKLQADVKRLGMDSYVIFLGYVEDEDLLALHEAGDIFVMPNRILEDGDTEGFGIVFLEASASGKPVIGGRAGGAIEAIEDGISGYLVDPYDTKELIEKALYLLSCQQVSVILGENGKQRARSKFKWKDLANKLQQEILMK